MASANAKWLQDLTWEDVSLYLEQDNIILLPIGSTEQHGPAGPLGLDSYVAIGLAEDTAARSGVLIAPPLWYGDSSHHMGFAGTITLRSETLIRVVSDICDSLVGHGFKKIVVINGHKGANLPALKIALKALHEEKHHDALFSIADPMHLGRRAGAENKEDVEHHAGELEISQILYKYPSLIKEDKLTDFSVDFPGIFSAYSTNDLFGGGGDTIEMIWNSREQKKFAPQGSFSPSKKASREKGKRYHEAMVNNLVDYVDWLKKYNGPIGRV